jgi:hypothetical protein
VTIKNFLLKIIIIIIPPHLPICLRHLVIRRRHRPFHRLKIDKIVEKILKKKCQMIFLLLVVVVVVVVVVQVKLIFLKELNSFNFIATNELISYKVIFLLNKKRIKHSSVNLIEYDLLYCLYFIIHLSFNHFKEIVIIRKKFLNR